MAKDKTIKISRRAALLGAGALAMPSISYGQTGTIKIGMPTILSGRVAILGVSSVGAIKLALDQVNAAGGIEGRKLELIVRDSKGAPQEAAKVTRDLVNNEGCQIILDGEASSGSFAVQEVIRDLGVLCIHTNSETTSLTADPKLRVPTSFRTARQGIHDAIGGGEYAAQVAKEKNLTRWLTCSPDYAYGRENTAQFMEYAAYFNPQIKVVEEAWPKLFQPDYTEVVTKLLNAQADALFSVLWGGDLVAFIDQAQLYGLFDKMTSFLVNLGDYGIVDQVKQFPQGVYSGGRYNKTIPPTTANLDWYNAYVALNKSKPTNWSWENAVAAEFLIGALKDTKGNTDGKKLAAAMRGRTIPSIFGAKGSVTLRESDNTLIDYIIGFGVSTDKEPYIKDFHMADWTKILDLEKVWLKKQGYN